LQGSSSSGFLACACAGFLASYPKTGKSVPAVVAPYLLLGRKPPALGLKVEPPKFKPAKLKEGKDEGVGADYVCCNYGSGVKPAGTKPYPGAG
jgi:hypothetical protein